MNGLCWKSVAEPYFQLKSVGFIDAIASDKQNVAENDMEMVTINSFVWFRKELERLSLINERSWKQPLVFVWVTASTVRMPDEFLGLHIKRLQHDPFPPKSHFNDVTLWRPSWFFWRPHGVSTNPISVVPSSRIFFIFMNFRIWSASVVDSVVVVAIIYSAWNI